MFKSRNKKPTAEDEARRADLLQSRAREKDEAPRTIEAMQEEIDGLKKETGSSLDRTIAVLQETNATAATTNEQLAAQSEQMHRVRGTVAQTDQTLIDTDHKLKYKFSWMGVTKGMFTSGPKQSEEVAALQAAKDAKMTAASGAKAGGNGRGSGEASGAGSRAAPGSGAGGVRKSISAPTHGGGANGSVVSEFDTQLNTIDSLLDNLRVKAEHQNAQLKDQGQEADALVAATANVNDRVQSQNKQMHKRWSIF